MLEPIGNLIQRWRADPRPATTLALCQALAEAGELHRAAAPPAWGDFVLLCSEVGRTVAERFALDLDVLLVAGRMHLAAGATWDAQSVTLQAAKIAPDEPRAWVLLGEALLRRGDAARAQRSLARAMAAGVRVEPQLAALAQMLAPRIDLPRENIAELVARSLGYGVMAPPPGMPSIPVGLPSGPPPRPFGPASATISGLPSVIDEDDEPGEMTARHEFDHEQLMALLRATDEPGVPHAAPRATPSTGVVDEESLTRLRPSPARAPVHSDAFTLVRRSMEDESTTETNEMPTSIGHVSQELLDELRVRERAQAIDVPRMATQSLEEIAPTLARQLAPRSPNFEHHPLVEDETTAPRLEESVDLRAALLALPRPRQPETPPAARVIVAAPPGPALRSPTPRSPTSRSPTSRSPTPPGPAPSPAQGMAVSQRAMTAQRGMGPLPGLVEDASHSAEMPLPPSSASPGLAGELPVEGRRSGRRRVLGWLMAGTLLAAAGAAGAHVFRTERARGASEDALEAAKRSRVALDAGDLRTAQQLGDRAVELAPQDPRAVRAAVDARVLTILDGGVAPDAAVDALTTARRLGARGSVLAAAALAAMVGSGNGVHTQTLLDQHRRDGVDRDDPIYLLAEGAALDLVADPAAIDAYTKAHELAPSLSSARIRLVRALVFAGRVGEAQAAMGGAPLPRPVETTLEVLLARAERPDRWPERDVRTVREDVGDLPRPLRAIGAALALVPPDAQGAASVGIDAALDDADAPAALLLCGQLALAAGDLDGALGAARRAVEMRPDWTPAHALSARVLLLRGQLEEALALEPSLPPSVAAELRAIAAYESGDPEALAEAESRAVEKGAPRWPALALALARLRSGAKRPAPHEADGLLAENVVWADVLAADLALDAGDPARAATITEAWKNPDPARALRLARLRRVKGDHAGAARMLEGAGSGRWAKVESVLLAAESKTDRKKVIAGLEDKDGPERQALGDLAPFALAYLRGREGAFQGAKAALTKVKVPRGGALEGRVMVLLGLAAARDTAQAKALTELIDALKGRPEVVWAGVMLGVLPPTRMPKGMN